MKLFKKTAAILMAMLMMALLTTTAFADEVDLSTHTFKAYQIFKGTHPETGEANLGDIEWGDGIDAEAFLAELQNNYDIYDSCTTALQVAQVLSQYQDYDNAEARAFAKTADKHLLGNGYDTGATLGAGYYLVVDTTDTDDKEDAKNLSLLQMTNKGTFDIANKTDIPKVEKKVQEEDYPTYGTTDAETGVTGYPLTNGYNDVADYDIGDAVPFELIGTMPSTLADYDSYNYIFHDTLSAGLTFKDDARVYLVNKGVKTEVSEFSITSVVNADGTTAITVSCDNVKNIANVTKDSMFVVEYTAELNKDAEIGLEGNPNEVYLEYSNNPNKIGEGENGTGKTKIDKVIVFTYELDGTKVDGEDTTKVLKDAIFVLQRSSDDMYYVVDSEGNVSWTADENSATELKSDKNGNFNARGIEDGEYKLYEKVAPTGYNKLADPIVLTVAAATENGQTWAGDPKAALTALTITIDDKTADGDLDDGIVEVEVKNNKGSELPETGGIGTTVFYIVGSVLVLGAAVLLITKKRMGSNK